MRNCQSRPINLIERFAEHNKKLWLMGRLEGEGKCPLTQEESDLTGGEAT